jgi:hypothetical protein
MLASSSFRILLQQMPVKLLLKLVQLTVKWLSFLLCLPHQLKILVYLVAWYQDLSSINLDHAILREGFQFFAQNIIFILMLH